MKRRTLDILFSIGGVAIAGLLVIAGLVLASNASFANDYVTTQLSQQNIKFKTADTLTAEEKGQACLVEYAGQQLTTGKQAERTTSSGCTWSRPPVARPTPSWVSPSPRYGRR